MTKRTLRRNLRFFSRFGARTGMRASRLHSAPRGTMIELKLPQLAHPLWARAQTSDVETFEEVFVTREYQHSFENFSPKFILDLGANVGFASVFFSSQWPEAKVLAVEPVGSN